MRHLRAEDITRLPGKAQTRLICWAEAKNRKDGLQLKLLLPIVANALFFCCYLLLRYTTQGVEAIEVEVLLKTVRIVNAVLGMVGLAVFTTTYYLYHRAKQEELAMYTFLSVDYDCSDITADDVLTHILMPRLSEAGLTKKECRDIARGLWAS